MQQLGTLSPSPCPQGLLVPCHLAPPSSTHTLEDKCAGAGEDQGGGNQQHALAWKEGKRVREADTGGSQSRSLDSLHLPAAAHPDGRPGQACGPRGKEGGQEGCWDQMPHLDPPHRSGGRSLFIPGVTKRASGKFHQTGDPSPSLDQGYSTPDPSIAWVSNTRTPCLHTHAPRHEVVPKTSWPKPRLPGGSSPGHKDGLRSLLRPVQGHTAQHCRILSASSLVRSPQGVSGADAG